MALDEKRLGWFALECGCSYEIHTVAETDSTNNELKRLAEKGAPHGYALAADRQTAGRGMHGRGFFSPESGVYMSVLLRPNTPPEEALHYTAAAGVAVCGAIEKLTAHRAMIKWVNDVYIGDRKVCGILTESVIENGIVGRAVIGIGVNISEPKGGFPEDIRGRAGALFAGGENVPECFADRLAAEIFGALERQISLRWGDTLAEYRSRSWLTGREVILSNGTKALVTGIAEDGSLIVKREDGSEESIGSGYSVTAV